MAAQTVFEEHLGVIGALRENYARTEDAQAIAGLVRAQQDVAAASQKREEQIKDIVKELTSRVYRAENAAAYPTAADAHQQQMAQVHTASQQAQENVDSLNRQLEALQQQRQQIKEQVAGLQQKAEHIEQIVTEAEPRTRHQLSLYAHVSKITWQFEHRHHVAGAVANPLRAFDFDPDAMSDYDIVNALWDLMGTDD